MSSFRAAAAVVGSLLLPPIGKGNLARPTSLGLASSLTQCMRLSVVDVSRGWALLAAGVKPISIQKQAEHVEKISVRVIQQRNANLMHSFYID